jgi:hypothetical protein
MSKAASNAAVLTRLSIGTGILNQIGASIVLEAVLTGTARIDSEQAIMLANAIQLTGADVREALAIEVNRLADAAEPTNSAPTLEDFLKSRRQPRTEAARPFNEPREEAGVEELRKMADQPATSLEIDGMTFQPIGAIKLPAGATAEQFKAAVADFLSSLGRAPQQKH